MCGFLTNIFRWLCCILVLCGVVSCNEGPEMDGISAEADRFLEKRTPGLVKGKNYKLLYNESAWQTMRNKQRMVLCIQRDDQSSYLHLKVEPGSLGNTQDDHTVNVVLSYKTDVNGQEISEALEMEVLKSQDMQVWLWNEESKTGVIMPL